MKLTDIFKGINEIGKEVRFYPKLNVITGSNNASILLCYLIGWYGNQADKTAGWMYQSNSDISEQTGLTRKEQQHARKALRDLGVIEEQLRGIPRIAHYRLKIDVLNEIWDRYHQDPDSFIPHNIHSLHESSNQVGQNAQQVAGNYIPHFPHNIHSLHESSNQVGQNAQQAGQNAQQAGQNAQQAGQNAQQAGQNAQQAGQNAQLYTVSSSVSSSVDSAVDHTVDSAVSPRAHDAHAHAPTRDMQNTTPPKDNNHPSSSQTSSSIAVDAENPIPTLQHPDKNSTTLFDAENPIPTPPTSQNHENFIPLTPPSGTPPSSRTKSKSSKSAEPADPAVKRIIDSFHDAVVETYGFKPGLQAGRDGKAIKQMLPYADEEILTGYVVGFVSSGQWKTEDSPYIFEFVTGKRINAYRIRLSEQEGGVPVVKDVIPYEEIIAHLNDLSGSAFKASDPSTTRLIDARWKDGYRFEDFRKVIENMTAKWGRDAKMIEFLRPATLFSEKFGNYLGMRVTPVDTGLVSQVGYRAHQAGEEWIRQEEERERRAEENDSGTDHRDSYDLGTSMDLADGCGDGIVRQGIQL